MRVLAQAVNHGSGLVVASMRAIREFRTRQGAYATRFAPCIVAPEPCDSSGRQGTRSGGRPMA